MKNSKGTRKRRSKRHSLSDMLKRFFNISLIALFLTTAISGVSFGHDKVAEGAKDISRGVASVPGTVAETANDSNIISGLVVGTAKGVLTAVEGVCEGVYKILTFHRND